MAQGVERRCWGEAEGRTAVTAWSSSAERRKNFAHRYGVNSKTVL